MGVGERHGTMTVIGDAPQINGRYAAIFLCDCGKEIARPLHLVRISERDGCTPSCGCVDSALKSQRGKNRITHGLSWSKLYAVRRMMIRRCYDPTCKDFPHWGARGITVCDEWRAGIRPFFDWAMASGYKDGVTIERRDNNGPYCPENCTWIPNERQAANTRRLRMITLDGETHYVSEWSRRLNMPLRTILSRLRYGWSDEDTLRRPVR